MNQISPRKHNVFKGLCGAATKSRTRDLMITNQLLYQLSYSGIVEAQNSQLVGIRQAKN
jgi:hypothetical protein